MKAKGTKFTPGKVTEWLDCGNKDATVYTNQRILEFNKNGLRKSNFINQNSSIIEPCFIGENVQLINSMIGPHASIGASSIIENSVVQNSIIQTNSKILLFLGEGLHKIKRKAEQLACEEALQKLSSYSV